MSQPRTLSDFPNPRRKVPAFARRLIKGLAALAILAVVGLAILLALLWREHSTDFTTRAEDLASHGYIVVGFDAPYRTSIVVFPDKRIVTRPPAYDPENLQGDQADRLINRLLPMWTSDTKFVVSQLEQMNAADPSGKFTGRLDMQRLGMFGHSFGGATALQFCHDDPR